MRGGREGGKGRGGREGGREGRGVGGVVHGVVKHGMVLLHLEVGASTEEACFFTVSGYLKHFFNQPSHLL